MTDLGVKREISVLWSKMYNNCSADVRTKKEERKNVLQKEELFKILTKKAKKKNTQKIQQNVKFRFPYCWEVFGSD